MFDPKILLDQLTGAGRGAAQGRASSGLGGLAGQVLDMAQKGLGQPRKGAGAAGGTDFLGMARDFMQKNPGAATAILGGLGSLVMKKGGIGNIAKLGGLALIGSMAYKAYQDYQAGRTPLEASVPSQVAPQGSGFEPQAATDDNAMLLIRAMIAAAAADGTIDASERTRILAGIQEAGLDDEAAAWLDREMANPASIDSLAKGAATPQLAAQVYMAARIAIDPDHAAEQRFLAGLASMLGLAPDLVRQIDATARQATQA